MQKHHFQRITKKLHPHNKKNDKKSLRYQKNIYLCNVLINTIVLQIKKEKKMKKLVFAVVAFAAISFAATSCDQTKKTEAPVDTTAVEEVVDTTVEEVVDTTTVEEVVEEAAKQ